MKNKKKYIFIIIILLLCSIIIYLLNENHGLKESSNNYENNKVTKSENMLSMMLETEANSGNYEMTTSSSWPTDGYVFNTELSKCENGGELSWDNTTKQVLMSGNVSDKCYVYFDIYVPPTIADFCNSGDTLTTCVKNFGNQGTDMSNIYIHNSGLNNGAGDNSYRYAGASESVNNFVCFGTNTTPCPTDNLYRIIGVFGDQVKLIKYDYANSNLLGTDGDYSTNAFAKSDNSTYKGELTTINRYYWNNSTQTNTWSESNLNKVNLNTNFINNIRSEWAKKIATTTWKVGGNTNDIIAEVTPSVAYQNEIVNPVTTNTTDGETEYRAKIGLMYVSDYGFAAAPSAWTRALYEYQFDGISSPNWMYMGLHEWTISRVADDSYAAFLVDIGGGVYGDGVVDTSDYGVRPSFNLLSSVTYVEGDGTKNLPIRIN